MRNNVLCMYSKRNVASNLETVYDKNVVLPSFLEPFACVACLLLVLNVSEKGKL